MSLPHEHCYCWMENENQDKKSVCKAYCTDDEDCKGYHYSLSSNNCNYMTDAACESGCRKRNPGAAGSEVQNNPDENISGCFIKKSIMLYFCNKV